MKHSQREMVWDESNAHKYYLISMVLVVATLMTAGLPITMYIKKDEPKCADNATKMMKGAVAIPCVILPTALGFYCWHKTVAARVETMSGAKDSWHRMHAQRELAPQCKSDQYWYVFIVLFVLTLVTTIPAIYIHTEDENTEDENAKCHTEAKVCATAVPSILVGAMAFMLVVFLARQRFEKDLKYRPGMRSVYLPLVV